MAIIPPSHWSPDHRRMSTGRDLGVGFWSEASSIELRLAGAFGDEDDEGVDADAFFAARLAAACARRDELRGHTTGLRLVHGNADGLPGLVIDQYADSSSCG